MARKISGLGKILGVGILGVASLVSGGCVGYSGYHTFDLTKDKDVFVLEAISFKQSGEERDRIKNAYITNQNGDVIYTIVENTKFNRELRDYKTHTKSETLHSAGCIVFPEPFKIFSTFYNLETSGNNVCYFLIVESVNGTVGVDDERENTTLNTYNAGKDPARTIIERLRLERKIGN